MSVVKLTKADLKQMKPMSLEDLLTDEQKAARYAEQEEKWNQRAHERMFEKIAACRADLAKSLRDAAELAEQVDGDALYKLDSRTMIDYAARIRVWSRLAQKAPEASFTAWREAARQQATRHVLNEIHDSQSSCVLSNHVKLVELKLYRDFTQDWMF